MRNVQLPRSLRHGLHSDASASSDTRPLLSKPNEEADTEEGGNRPARAAAADSASSDRRAGGGGMGAAQRESQCVPFQDTILPPDATSALI